VGGEESSLGSTGLLWVATGCEPLLDEALDSTSTPTPLPSRQVQFPIPIPMQLTLLLRLQLLSILVPCDVGGWEAIPAHTLRNLWRQRAP